MPGKYFRQSIGKIASQTFLGSFSELQFKREALLDGVILFICKSYIISTFFGIAIKCFKELIRSLRREKIIKYLLGKNGVKIFNHQVYQLKQELKSRII